MGAGYTIDDYESMDVRHSSYIVTKEREKAHRERWQNILDIAHAVQMANVSTLSKNGMNLFERWKRRIERIINPQKVINTIWDRLPKGKSGRI